MIFEDYYIVVEYILNTAMNGGGSITSNQSFYQTVPDLAEGICPPNVTVQGANSLSDCIYVILRTNRGMCSLNKKILNYSMRKAFLEKVVVEQVYKFDKKSYRECLKR